MKVLVVRHGKTDFNVGGKRIGKEDADLNGEGKNEALEIKKELKGNYNILICSPMKRTRQTADIIFPGRDLIINDLIVPYDFGELQGVPFDTPYSKFPNNRVEKHGGKEYLMPNKGESFEEFVTRCKKFIKYLKKNFNEDDKIAVFTHSTFIAVLIALSRSKPWYTYLDKTRGLKGSIEIEI
jgi:alpha-ribazole phosphatase